MHIQMMNMVNIIPAEHQHVSSVVMSHASTVSI